MSKTCHNCQEPNLDTAKYCKQCGNPFIINKTEKSGNRKQIQSFIIVLILAFGTSLILYPKNKTYEEQEIEFEKEVNYINQKDSHPQEGVTWTDTNRDVYLKLFENYKYEYAFIITSDQLYDAYYQYANTLDDNGKETLAKEQQEWLRQRDIGVGEMNRKHQDSHEYILNLTKTRTEHFKKLLK